MPLITTVLCEHRPVGYSSPGTPDWKPADADADEDEPANNFQHDNGAAISLVWQFVCVCDPRVCQVFCLVRHCAAQGMRQQVICFQHGRFA